MKTIPYLSLLALVVTLFSCKNKDQSIMNSEQLVAKAKAIHKNVITLDTHDDINIKNFTDSLNYTADLSSQITLPKMKTGGLDVAWFIVYTGQSTLDADGYAKAEANAMSKFDAIHRLTEKYASDKMELALTSADVRRIHKAGKLVAMIGVENAYPMGLDVNNVKKFYDLGARYMSLSHNGHSQFCDSNTGEEDNVWLYNGLSDLGKEALAAMNKWGIMVDVSHPSKQSFLDMIKLSKAPIIASHSSARALCNHSRNLDDEQLKLLAKNGGVVQTVAFSSYLNTAKDSTYNAALKPLYTDLAKEIGFELITDRKAFATMDEATIGAYFANYTTLRKHAEKDPRLAAIKKNTPPVGVTDFVDHIDYLVDLIGIDHVGISSDFDGGGGIEGWHDASETFNVTLELVKRGYTETQIAKIWSGNLLRVLDDVQKVAQQLQAK